eukprot:1185363-Prorocentrum_minimum.AAC.1
MASRGPSGRSRYIPNLEWPRMASGAQTSKPQTPDPPLESNPKCDLPPLPPPSLEATRGAPTRRYRGLCNMHAS